MQYGFFDFKNVPNLTITSPDIINETLTDNKFTSGKFPGFTGQDVSPEINWGTIPEETKSLMVSMFDPDAITRPGYMHWLVINIPNTVNQLVQNAGSSDQLLPKGAQALLNTRGSKKYLGAAPPKNTGIHHYIITVLALDVAKLTNVTEQNYSELETIVSKHVLARGTIIYTIDSAK